MAGGIVMAILLVVVMPVGLIMTGALVAAALGWTVKDNAEQLDDGTWTSLNT